MQTIQHKPIMMNTISHTKWICAVIALLFSIGLKAQEADNIFSVDLYTVTRGELRKGGIYSDSTDSKHMANFVIGKYRLDFDYKRSSWLELRLSPQQTAVWGQTTGGFSLFEGWALFQSQNGLFAKVGRQLLSYDDGRILGYDDWAMTDPSYDVLKMGYEGRNHKFHVILSYNQNPTVNENATSYYTDGLQPNKMMQTLWYHFDTPMTFGASLLFMNIGMESVDPLYPNKVFFQQLLGTYMSFNPKHWFLKAGFYYQMGKEAGGLPLDAFLSFGKVTYTPNDNFSLFGGYDYLSGVKLYDYMSHTMSGSEQGYICSGFNPMYGSHHDFYSALDFFYMDSFEGNFTPGLQNLYAGVTVNPIRPLELDLTYHYFAIASDLDYVPSKKLGHEIDFEADYTFSDIVKLSAGYTFLLGSKTMDIVQQKLDENHKMHWGWLMLTINPKSFTTSWRDKNKH